MVNEPLPLRFYNYLGTRKLHKGCWGNGSVGKVFLCKLENLSSILGPTLKPDLMAHACNPSAGEVETEDPWVSLAT